MILEGSVCDGCGQHHFPRAEVCPYCGREGARPVELPSTGTLWAWTAVTSPPPGYRGDVPYGFGVVELPVGLRVITRLTESEGWTVGDPVHLEEVTIAEDLVTYAFAPGS